MDITTLLSGFSNGKIDKGMADTIAGCFNNENGGNNSWWIIILLFLFWGNGFGGNNCGGYGCGNYGRGCGNPGYYTYYDPCVNGSNYGFNSNLNYVQPNYYYPQGGGFQSNYYGNNCGGGGGIFFLIIIIFLLGGKGFRSNRKDRDCGECSELDFTQIN